MKIESGHWYWYFDCRKCKKPIPFLEDESKGKIELVAGPDAMAGVTCPTCGKVAQYLLKTAKKGSAETLQ